MQTITCCCKKTGQNGLESTKNHFTGSPQLIRSCFKTGVRVHSQVCYASTLAERLLCKKDALGSSARRLGPWCSWKFQQANDPKLTSKVVKEWLHQAGITVLEWLPSPDLNHIKRMWTVLKKQVPARKPNKIIELLYVYSWPRWFGHTFRTQTSLIFFVKR